MAAASTEDTEKDRQQRFEQWYGHWQTCMTAEENYNDSCMF